MFSNFLVSVILSVEIKRREGSCMKQNLTLVTLGWSSLCQTTTSCVKAALREAISASDRWPSSPQSRSLTKPEEEYKTQHEKIGKKKNNDSGARLFLIRCLGGALGSFIAKVDITGVDLN